MYTERFLLALVCSISFGLGTANISLAKDKAKLEAELAIERSRATVLVCTRENPSHTYCIDIPKEVLSTRQAIKPASTN